MTDVIREELGESYSPSAVSFVTTDPDPVVETYVFVTGSPSRVASIADLVVTEGHLLEPGSRVTNIWIDGRAQDVANRQTELWQRYSERFERVKASQVDEAR